MNILSVSTCVLALGCAFLGGANIELATSQANFQKDFGFELRKMYEAKSKCEELAGKGNCIIMGAAIPRPAPVIMDAPPPLPSGRES